MSGHKNKLGASPRVLEIIDSLPGTIEEAAEAADCTVAHASQNLMAMYRRDMVEADISGSKRRYHLLETGEKFRDSLKHVLEATGKLDEEVPEPE